MNQSRRKPTSCRAVPGSSPSESTLCMTILHFPISFHFLPHFSSLFFFLSFFLFSLFLFSFSLLFWFPLLSPDAHLLFHFCFFFSPFPPFSLSYFYFSFFFSIFSTEQLFLLKLVWDQVVVTHALTCHPLTLSPMHEAMWSYIWPSCHGRCAIWHHATCHHAISPFHLEIHEFRPSRNPT